MCTSRPSIFKKILLMMILAIGMVSTAMADSYLPIGEQLDTKTASTGNALMILAKSDRLLPVGNGDALRRWSGAEFSAFKTIDDKATATQSVSLPNNDGNDPTDKKVVCNDASKHSGQHQLANSFINLKVSNQYHPWSDLI